ncbi:glycosyltransferase family 87 protein [Actinacidiphila oryziradicis]|nr:glycosyltransferase family 87 protein [Actinacidiphila oryziradicis]
MDGLIRMDADKTGGVGWLLRPASWPVRAAAAAVLVAAVLEVYRRSHSGGMDNAFVVRAARSFLDGGSPYADKRFLYLPSAVLAAVPEALLPDRVLRAVVPVGVAGLVLGGWWCSLRIFGVWAGSRLAVLGAGGLAYFAPFRNLLLLGNWTAVSVAALPLALLLVVRARWVAAGAVIGAAVAVKPMLVPFALLFVFAGRWRALAVAVAIPAAGSVAAALAIPHPGYFFTRTVPFLLRGQDPFAGLYDASLGAVLPRLGVPRGLALAFAMAVAAVGVWCAWRRWRRADDTPMRVVETGTMLMLSAFLVSRPSFDHYVLVVLLPLLASVVVPGSAARTPWFWIALVPQIPVIDWPYVTPLTRRAFKDAAMFCGLAAVLAWRCAVPVRPVRLRRASPAGPPLCPQEPDGLTSRPQTPGGLEKTGPPGP